MGHADDGAYRGLYRLLSEEHLPFAVSDNLSWLGKRQFDLVIAAHWAPQELKAYAENGGKLLIVSARPPSFSVADVIRTIAGHQRLCTSTEPQNATRHSPTRTC